MSVNKVILVGNLGRDPELRYTPSGTAIASFTMATTDRFKDRDGNNKEVTEWHNIVAWRNLAEICAKYIKKGRQIYLEGKLQTRSYEDKEGVRKYVTEIVASVVEMLGKPDDVPAGKERKPARSENPPASNDPIAPPPFNPDDDVPF